MIAEDSGTSRQGAREGLTPVTIRFVDISCHCEGVCPHKLRQIRSHVAKTAHTRRKQPERLANTARSTVDLKSNFTDGCDRLTSLRAIRPKINCFQTQAALGTKPWTARPMPAFTPYAWNLSNDEHFLLNFCKKPTFQSVSTLSNAMLGKTKTWNGFYSMGTMVVSLMSR